VKVAWKAGVRPAEFWDLAPWEFSAVLDAYMEKDRARAKEERFYTAHLMWASLSPYAPKGKRFRVKEFIDMLTPQRHYPGTTPKEQREAWEREQEELERRGVKNV